MMKSAVWLAMAVLAAGFASAQDLERKAPPEVEQALRDRVTGFYQAFKAGQFREAEAFVAEDSRDAFYGAKKNRILSYEISTIEFNEDFKEAHVLVASKTIIPMLGSAPLTVPLSSNWRWAGGDWYMHLVQKEGTDVVETPFGSMKFGQQAGGMPFPTQRPTIATLKNMVEVENTDLTFTPDGGLQTQAVKLSNKASGDLTLESYSREMPGLKIEAPEKIPAKSQAEIKFTYNPEEAKITGKHRFEFMVLPINQPFQVYLQF